MRFLSISILILLFLPVQLFSQQIEENNHSSIIVTSEHYLQENLHLVTPVLLRTSPQLNADYQNESTFWNNSAVSFFSSLIVPGSSQIANRNWFRAGLFVAIEAVSIYMIVDNKNRGRSGERNYERFANNNWSVVQYSEWLINYHDFHGINNPYISDLRNQIEGKNAEFDTVKDWNKVDISLLRNVERNTPYITTDELFASNFSHALPDYGSQQYYELIAKYYQYQAGWRDYDEFHNDLGHTGNFFNQRYFIDRNGGFASTMFFDGVRKSEQFNKDFRKAGQFTSLLIANHFISAFDSYFTLKAKQNRLRATSSVLPGQQIIVSYSF